MDIYVYVLLDPTDLPECAVCAAVRQGQLAPSIDDTTGDHRQTRAYPLLCRSRKYIRMEAQLFHEGDTGIGCTIFAAMQNLEIFF